MPLDPDSKSVDTTPMSNDPRGPLRTVASVEPTPEATPTRFIECDHVAKLNRAMAAAKPGEKVRCFHCGPKGERS